MKKPERISFGLNVFESHKSAFFFFRSKEKIEEEKKGKKHRFGEAKRVKEKQNENFRAKKNYVKKKHDDVCVCELRTPQTQLIGATEIEYNTNSEYNSHDRENICLISIIRKVYNII